MKRHLCKIGALVVALAMVLAMSIVAMADDDPATTPTRSSGDTQLSITTVEASSKYTVKFDKEIKAIGTGTICAPDATYTYSVGTATTIQGSSSSTKPTVTIPASVEFSNGRTADNGNAFSLEGTFNIDTSVATAGVYMYEITEQSSNAETNGITEYGTYNANRYLVVYVNSDRVVTNAILYTDASRNEAHKTSGWLASGSVDNYHKYETVNVTIEKEITGSHADKTHEFRFTFQVKCENGSKVTLDDSTSPSVMKADMTADLSDGETAVIKNVPKDATATVYVTEKNDTLDDYYVTTTSLTSNLSNEKAAPQADKGGETGNITTNTTIKFTNNLPNLSPTGLIFRVAPYIAMAAVGIPLFVVMTRRRKATATR